MKKRYLLIVLAAIVCHFSLYASAFDPARETCDTLFTRDGRVLLVQVTHISPKGVKYWLCNAPNDNQKYFMPLSEVQEIRWETTRQRELYQVWVHEYGSQFPLRGYLLATTDSTVILIRSLRQPENTPRHVIPVTRIKSLRFREKGRLGKSILAGAVVGAGTGFVIGQAQGDDPERNSFSTPSLSAGEKSILNMFVLVPAGAGAGFIIGAFKKTVDIRGNPDNYRLLRPMITRYTVSGR